MPWDPSKLDSEWPFEIFQTTFVLDPGATALLVIDLQADQMTVTPESPIATQFPNIAAYWANRVEESVIPNSQKLITHFRERGLKIIYTRNGGMTSTGEETTRRLRAKACPKGSRAFRGTPDYEIDERLSPRPEDLVIDKLTSGGFTASTLDHALHNMGIRGLVLAGVLTDACVFGTARAAAELGYDTLLCEDACGTYTQRAHDDALLMHARIFGRVDTTDGVIAELR